MDTKFDVISDELLDEVVGGAAGTDLGKFYEKKYDMKIENKKGVDTVRIRTIAGTELTTKISKLKELPDRVASYQNSKGEFVKFPTADFKA